MKFALTYPLALVLACTSTCRADNKIKDPELDKLQGTWTTQKRDAQGNAITITKVITGNHEQQVIKRGDHILQQHQAEFDIEKTDHVRIFTYRKLTITAGPGAGTTRTQPMTPCVYRVTNNDFLILHGVMTGDTRPFDLDLYRRATPENTNVDAN